MEKLTVLHLLMDFEFNNDNNDDKLKIINPWVGTFFFILPFYHRLFTWSTWWQDLRNRNIFNDQSGQFWNAVKKHFLSIKKKIPYGLTWNYCFLKSSRALEAAVLYLMAAASNHQGHLDAIYYPDSISNRKIKAFLDSLHRCNYFFKLSEAGRSGERVHDIFWSGEPQSSTHVDIRYWNIPAENSIKVLGEH